MNLTERIDVENGLRLIQIDAKPRWTRASVL